MENMELEIQVWRGQELVGTEVDCFVGPHWLITVRKDESFPIDAVVSRWDESAHLLTCGVK